MEITSDSHGFLNRTWFRLVITIAVAGLLAQAAGANPSTTARAVVGRITLKPGSDPGFELGNCSGFVVNNTRTLRRDVGVEHDGTFRIEGLPAGVYDLSLDALEGGKNGGVTVKGAWGNERSGVLAIVRLRFELPSAGDAATSAPLDLGPQEIEISRTVRVGREAPAFKCATLEGDEVGTRDWRGKYVLLDFWASWCGPCRLEMPHLKALYNEYGKDPRFVMVSLSLDKDMDKQEACVKENGMKWVQGILGDWSRDRISLKYGVRSIPSMFLLGPDGRIIEMSASGKAMHASVARALGKASR